MKKVYVMTERWYEYKYDPVSNMICGVDSESYVVGVYSTKRKAWKGLIKRVSENGFKPDCYANQLNAIQDKYGIWYLSNGSLMWDGEYRVENPVFLTKPYTVNVAISVQERIINKGYYENI